MHSQPLGRLVDETGRGPEPVDCVTADVERDRPVAFERDAIAQPAVPGAQIENGQRPARFRPAAGRSTAS